MSDRRIYRDKYDPLVVWRELVRHSDGKINEWIKVRQGDDLLAAAEAEEKLVRITRDVFALDAFPAVTDQEALDLLADFNGWLSGKGDRG